MKKMNLLSLVARNTMILFLILLLGLTLNAQVTVPDGINYQAIARNASGAPLVSTALVVKVIIYDGATVVWTGPEQSVTTNNFGLFTMVVTQASSIVWQNLTTPKIEVQALIGESDGWVSMGIVNIWSVPYAKVAGNVTPLNAVFNLTNTTGLTGDCTGGYAGALTVAGGTALNGNTGIKGLLTVCGNTSIESRAFINSMYNATNDIDGALVVKGGVSVQQDVYGNAKATFKQWLKVGNTTVGLVGPNCGPWTQATLLVDGVSAFNYNVNIKGDLDVCGNISGTNFWGTTFHGTFYGPLHGWADNAYYATTAGYAENAHNAAHAGDAAYATHAHDADYATTAGYATNALNATNAGTATNANYAGTANYAYIAGYANIGIASQLGTSTICAPAYVSLITGCNGIPITGNGIVSLTATAFNVTAPTNITGTLGVTLATTLGNTLGVAGATTIGGVTTINSIIDIGGTACAPTGGALIVAGGARFAKSVAIQNDLKVCGDVYGDDFFGDEFTGAKVTVNGTNVLTGSCASWTGTLTVNGSAGINGLLGVSDDATFCSNVSIQSPDDVGTAGGPALAVTGGVEVAKSLWVSQQIEAGRKVIIGALYDIELAGGCPGGYTDAELLVQGDAGFNEDVGIKGYLDVCGNITAPRFYGNTYGTHYGNVGADGSCYNAYLNNIYTCNGLNINASTNISGVVNITNATNIAQTGCATGALVVTGGVGIAKDLRVCGNTYGTFYGPLHGRADNATNADYAVTATYATNAGYATTAGYATLAGTAAIALHAHDADYATTAGYANIGVATQLGSPGNCRPAYVSLIEGCIGSGIPITGNGIVSLSATAFNVTAPTNITGNTKVTGTFWATDATTLSSTLGVTGATTLGNTLGVAGATTIAGVTTITNTTPLDGTCPGNFTGALQVAGGAAFNQSVGIKTNLTVCGTTNLANTIINGAALSPLPLACPMNGPYTGALTVTGGSGLNGDVGITGSLRVSGEAYHCSPVYILNDNDATNIYSGALRVTGGVGIARGLYVGLDLNVLSRAFIGTSNVPVAPKPCGLYTDGTLVVNGEAGFNYDVYMRQNLNVCGTITAPSFIGNTYGTHYGNVGSAGTCFNAYLNNIYSCTGLNINAPANISGVVNIDNTTQSTSCTTGALIVDGGVGIAKDLRVCGNIYGTVYGNFYGPLHGWADNAYYATTAGYATNAGNADIATTANYAYNAGTAQEAVHATTATNADYAHTADYAFYAGHATNADLATTATVALQLGAPGNCRNAYIDDIFGCTPDGITLDAISFHVDAPTTIHNTLGVTGITTITNGTLLGNTCGNFTGALQVAGGAAFNQNVGVSGYLDVCGNVSGDNFFGDDFYGETFYGNLSGASAHIVGAALSPLPTFCAMGPYTGALTVTGGSALNGDVGIYGSLRVQAETYHCNPVLIKHDADATNVSSGALQVAGGVGIAKSAWIGQNLHVLTSAFIGFNNVPVAPTLSGSMPCGPYGYGTLIVNGEAGFNEDVYMAKNLNVCGDVTALHFHGNTYGTHYGNVYGSVWGTTYGTHFGDVGAPGQCFDFYADTIYGCSDVVVKSDFTTIGKGLVYAVRSSETLGDQYFSGLLVSSVPSDESASPTFEAGVKKTYMIEAFAERDQSIAMTGDSRDALFKGTYVNLATNDVSSNAIGLSLNMRNGYTSDSHPWIAGTINRIMAGEMGVLNKSTSTAARAQGLDVTVENYGTVTDELRGLKVDLRNEGAPATIQYGILVYNSDASTTNPINAGYTLGNGNLAKAVNGGFTYGLDFSGATIGTADLRLENGGTIYNNVAGLVTVGDKLKVDDTQGLSGPVCNWTNAALQVEGGALIKENVGIKGDLRVCGNIYGDFHGNLSGWADYAHTANYAGHAALADMATTAHVAEKLGAPGLCGDAYINEIFGCAPNGITLTATAFNVGTTLNNTPTNITGTLGVTGITTITNGTLLGNTCGNFTGALQVAGGAAFNQNVGVSGYLDVCGNVSGDNFFGDDFYGDNFYGNLSGTRAHIVGAVLSPLPDACPMGGPYTGALTVTGGAALNGNVGITGSLRVNAETYHCNVVLINYNDDASNTYSGALRVAGGVGISGNAYIGKQLHVLTNAFIGFSDVPVAATSPGTMPCGPYTDGTLIVNGEAGFNHDVYMRENLHVCGNITALSFTGNTYGTHTGNVIGNTYGTHFGNVGAAGSCYDIYADTIRGCSDVAVKADLTTIGKVQVYPFRTETGEYYSALKVTSLPASYGSGATFQAGVKKTYMFEAAATRDVASTGDARDALFKGTYTNLATNGVSSNAIGLSVNMRNGSTPDVGPWIAGTIDRIMAGEIGVLNKSTSTANRVQGLDITVENYGTVTSEFRGLKVDLRNEGAVATTEYGILVNNSNGSVPTAVGAGYKLANVTANAYANNGFTYGLDFNGATIGTADIRLANGKTFKSSTGPSNVALNTNFTVDGEINVGTGGTAYSVTSGDNVLGIYASTVNSGTNYTDGVSSIIYAAGTSTGTGAVRGVKTAAIQQSGAALDEIYGVDATVSLESGAGAVVNAYGSLGFLNIETANKPTQYATGLMGIYDANTDANSATNYTSAIMGVIRSVHLNVPGATYTPDAAFLAFYEGDTPPLGGNPLAAFKAMDSHSTSTVGFQYGLDLFDAVGSNLIQTADIRLENGTTIKSSGTGLIEVGGDFKTTQAVYGNVRALASGNTLSTDYIILASVAFNLPVLDAASTGRILIIRNTTGGAFNVFLSDGSTVFRVLAANEGIQIVSGGTTWWEVTNK